jgi:uncharacterized protein
MKKDNNIDIVNKLRELRTIIKNKESLAVGLSGGIDSSLLAKIAFEELRNHAIALTIDSDILPRGELKMAKRIAREIGIKHILIKYSEMESEMFVKNPPDRCYYCRKEEIRLIRQAAAREGISNVAFGVNISDHNEHRPGIRALKEADFFLPLEEAGIKKSIIPKMAKILKLSNYNIGSTTCLASRIPYNEKITIQKLKQIEEGENFLYSLGIKHSRVRHHKDIARIEIPNRDFSLLLKNKDSLVQTLKKIGFKYISLDLQGYRSGSMDEVL